MDIIIRNANISESNQISPLIFDAIGDIAYRLTGESDEQKMLEALTTLVQSDNNRHSYLNTFVAVQNETVVGIIVLYDGQSGNALDRELERYLFAKHGRSITIDVEAHLDEFYIDTLCIHSKMRGLGLGTKLLTFAEEEAKRRGYSKLSLNVEVEKEKARALYQKLHFIETEKWTIIDEPFIHMVKNLS